MNERFRMKWFVALAIVAIALAPQAVALAQSDPGNDRTVLVYFISENGSDENPCTQEQPCATTSGVLVDVFEEGDIPTNPLELANFILAGGIGLAVSLILEWCGSWFHGMSTKAKFWVVFSLFNLLPIVAQTVIYIVSGFPPDADTIVSSYVSAIAYGATAWVASQWSHKVDTKISG